MTRPTAITGALLLAFALGVFAWKTLGMDLPVTPTDPRGMWQVELEITARGSGGRGSVRAALPSTDAAQIVFDERSVSDRLLFSIRGGAGQRTGVWSGRFRDLHHIVYGFRVQISELRFPLPSAPGDAPPAEIAREYGGASTRLPTDAQEITDRLQWLGLPGPEDPAGRVRAVYGFVSDEIATTAAAGDDALVTLALREGSPTGKARLLATLLRALGIPARLVSGLQLREGASPLPRVWVEAWLDRIWVPMSPSDGFFATRPADLLALRRGEGALVEATGVAAEGHRYLALRERLAPDELATVMVPPNPWLARISLYKLPVSTQRALRVLLLLPLGALVVTLFRNVVGVSTFGTFMPVLLALALRGTTLVRGLALVAFVLLVGVLGRLLLDRLRLLLVPRLSVLLCVVVLSVSALAIAGRGLGERDFYTGVLLPMVILTMLIERFSISVAEEGLREALTRALTSTLVAVAVYPIFSSSHAEHLMFAFPELVFAVMGVLVWIGGYTGYRFTDLARFRLLADGGARAR